MGLYERYILPHIIDVGCGSESIQMQREKVVPLAEGRVLEIGIGSGLNIPFYNSKKVDFVWGLEPSVGMHKKAKKNLNRPISKYIHEGGFHIKTMETLYLPNTPRVAGFNYVGVAKKG